MLALSMQLEATAKAVAFVMAGRSLSEVLADGSVVKPQLRAGVQALSFAVLRHYGMATTMRSLLAQMGVGVEGGAGALQRPQLELRSAYRRMAGGTAEKFGILLTLVAAILDLGVFAGLTGKTVGKWTTGLRIERTDGQLPGIGRALKAKSCGWRKRSRPRPSNAGPAPPTSIGSVPVKSPTFAPSLLACAATSRA